MQTFKPECRICLAYVALLIFSLYCKTLWAEQHTYSVGVVPQYDARQIFNTWNPILEYLSKQTGKQFILASSPDIPAFEQQLANGKFDFAYANPFQFLKAHQTQGYNAIVRDGQRQLQGIVVVNKNSGYDSPVALQDRHIALPAPNALGASLLVRYEFKLQGIVIKPQYVKSHKSVYLQVATGRMPAGGGVQSTFDAQPESIRNRLNIIYRTQTLAPHPIIVNPRIAKQDVEETIEAFLQLNQKPDGKTLLASIPMYMAVRTDMKDYVNLSTIDLKPFIQ